MFVCVCCESETEKENRIVKKLMMIGDNRRNEDL